MGRPSGSVDPWLIKSEDIAAALQPILDQHRMDHPPGEGARRSLAEKKYEQSIGTLSTKVGGLPRHMGALEWVAQETGVQPRRLYSIMVGETKNVTLKQADRIFSGVGHPEIVKGLPLVANPLWTDKAWAKWREVNGEDTVRRLGDEHYAHLSGDLYAVLDEQVIDLLTAAKEEFGSWRALAFRTGYRERVFRRWRNGGGRADRRRITIPMKVLDDILTAANLNQRLDELHWYTVEELVSLGIWKPMIPPHLALEDEPQGNAAS